MDYSQIIYSSPKWSLYDCAHKKQTPGLCLIWKKKKTQILQKLLIVIVRNLVWRVDCPYVVTCPINAGTRILISHKRTLLAIISLQRSNQKKVNPQIWRSIDTVLLSLQQDNTQIKQKKKVIISGSHRDTSWKIVVDSLHGLCPRRFRRNIKTSQSPSALVFLTWALVQCTQMMWTSSDTKW